MYSVNAGPPPAGACRTNLPIPSGVQRIQEVPTEFTALAAVTATGGTLTAVDLLAGHADVTVGADQSTTITFTNRSILGRLRLCKVAGPGVVVGTLFHFALGGSMYSVNAGPPPGGTCRDVASLPANVLQRVQETLHPGVVVSSVTVHNGTLAATSKLSAGYADVRMTANELTTVTFTNETKK